MSIGPLTFAASSGERPISAGVSAATGLLDCQTGVAAPGTPTDRKLPFGSSVYSKQPISMQQKIKTASNNARLNIMSIIFRPDAEFNRRNS